MYIYVYLSLKSILIKTIKYISIITRVYTTCICNLHDYRVYVNIIVKRHYQ